MKRKDENNERYALTPKGLANVAMLQTGLIDNLDDPRFEGFWSIFVAGMNEHGYIKPSEGDDPNDGE